MSSVGSRHLFRDGLIEERAFRGHLISPTPLRHPVPFLCIFVAWRATIYDFEWLVEEDEKKEIQRPGRGKGERRARTDGRE
jgi:hypothetical protein